MTPIFGGGNGCGHDPLHFRRFTPPSHRHPAVLEDARRRIGDCLGGFWDTHFAGERQKRSERREACGILLSCLIHRMDLVTLRVGIPDDANRMQGFTEKSLSRMTGLGLRRLERAMKDLVDMGFVSVQRRSERREDGSYKGFAAIRTIAIRFFDLIGLGKKLRKQRRKASQRQHDRSLHMASQKTFELMAKAFNKKDPQRQERPAEVREILRAMKSGLIKSTPM